MTQNDVDKIATAVAAKVARAQHFTASEVAQIRGFLRMWTAAKETTGKTILTAVVLFILAALAVGITLKVK